MRRMGIGLGVGINRSNYAQGIFSAYQSRVVADGGVTEAGTCVDAVSGLLQSASLLLIPSGYKSGKAYAEIPTNGNGDLTWTRASTALRTNSSGLLESMGSGVPRLSYMYGSCPALLLEPQRTNLAQNSGWVGGGSTPTGWSIVSIGGGSNTAVTSIKNTSVVAYQFSGTSARQFLFQGLAVSSGSSYSLSVFVESVTTAIKVSEVIEFGFSVGSVTYYEDSTVISSTANIQANKKYTAVATSSLTGVGNAKYGLGMTTGQTGNFVLSMPQFEQGAYATTFILTPTTASATRIADSFSRNNIFTNGLITSSGGTWFVELRNNIAYTRDAGNSNLFIGDAANNSPSNALEIRNGGVPNTRLDIGKRIGGTYTQLFASTTNTIKVALKWNGTSVDLFVNGTKEVTASSFSITNMEFLYLQNQDVPRFIQAMALYPTPLSDANCIALTS